MGYVADSQFSYVLAPSLESAIEGEAPRTLFVEGATLAPIIVATPPVTRRSCRKAGWSVVVCYPVVTGGTEFP